ncbi:lysoplasmalogenase-like protein TMEM86A [Uranotaenia lowii]|uniref:lysoplasmalogenase-like protein TMEM86A n=1 Tax=Uranotaenia lowii TaxID=190385 RepID=UPI002479AC11|nr:lysoplasmalogenase-like protein TMEM86A [Uranotaenia lowii]XP_055586559.1 lysoplasmalogenase-like protein TMEM86A [Uranotaenia lowii]XP_055586560.1 lysoplasmalogenase-like protein TMEM86A [Uranotaenia lowii]XP_055586561.1 lysoplasmalogenase-like protein TMEM86A [Uranotaenia lowii]
MARDGIGTITKFAGPRMLPFFVTVALYFSLIGQTQRRTVVSTVLKCLPIVSLWAFVVLTGFLFKRSHRYKHLILLGLVISCLGDLLLNYDLFEAGMGGFAVAQIFYISAFGFRPLRAWIGIPLFCFGVAAVALMFENLPTIIKICLPVYGVLLVTMCWRSLARINCPKNVLRTLCGIGSILFVISDSIIAFDKFYNPIENAQTAIMVTYYVAQFAIALSVLESTETESKKSQTANKLSSSVPKPQNGMKKSRKVV